MEMIRESLQGLSFGLSIFFCICTVICCGHKKPNGPPYQAHIVASTPSGYQLVTVEFQTLTDPDAVRGTLGEVLGDAVVNALADDTDIIDPSRRSNVYVESGKTVSLDYDIKGNVIYPKNFDSMALLAMYYNFERTFEFWREKLGLTLADFGQSRLFYAPRMRVSENGTVLEGTLKVNAAFVPGLRDFWFFKTSRLEGIPITMNFGVLAHEFSHSVFDMKFGRKDTTVYESESLISQDELSGINEGLADFFSYVVTGSVSEFGASLETVAKERTLPVSWTYSTLASSGCEGSYYCKGSILASALYEIATTGNRSAAEVGKIAFEAMSDFRNDWEVEKNNSTFDYNYYIGRFLARVDESQKGDYCTIFQKWFDSGRVRDNIGCP